MLKAIGQWGLQVVIVILLVACGGGGGTTITQPDQETTVTLADGGKLKFSAGSLEAGSTVTATQTSLPLLTDDLVAVGNAWKIDVDKQPSLPIEITLPVPEGEVGDDLILVRLESTGRISLLQTKLVNGMLVAQTPGFSDVLAARKQKLLASFSAQIDGPDFLPTNIAGQYSNSSMINDPSVQREWHVYEHSGAMGHQLVVDPRPLWDTSVQLSAVKAGSLTLMLEFSEPVTGLNVVAIKDVSIQQAVESGEYLDITIYAPVVVTEGVSFDFSAVVLNTDVTEMSRWEWSVGNHSGSCEAACSVRLDISGIELDNSGASNQLKVTGYAQSGIQGSATLDISALKNGLRLLRLEKVSSDNALLWDKNLNPNPQVSLRAEITGGTPPYVYNWRYYIYGPELISVEHNTYEESDLYTRTFDQPGKYNVFLNLADSSGEIISENLEINIKGAQPLEYGFVNPPGSSHPVNQPVTIQLQASGGVLLRNGEVQEGYEFLIEWGDGASEFGTITATDPDIGGNVTLQHTYTSEGDYKIRFILTDALRRPTLDDLDNVNISDLIRTSEFTVIDASAFSATVSSLFDNSYFSNEGWSIGPKTESLSWNNCGPAEQKASGGNPNGYITHTEYCGSPYISNGSWYFVAPTKFYGDKSDLFGSQLNFDLQSKYTNSGFGFITGFVVLSNANKHVFVETFSYYSWPYATWTHYSIPLSTNQSTNPWRVSYSNFLSSSEVATDSDIIDVLSNLTDLRILGAYGADPITGLDNVVLGAD